MLHGEVLLFYHIQVGPGEHAVLVSFQTTQTREIFSHDYKCYLLEVLHMDFLQGYLN